MIAISKEIWKFALSKEIILSAEYLLGRLNVRTDWVKWEFPGLDLSSSRACHQIPSYLSWKADPHSLATDGFQPSWKHRGLLYAFSPFSMTGRVLLKVKTKEVDVILITPRWPAQPWYSQVLESSVTEPLLLPQLRNILVDPQGQVHPLVVNKSLRLVAWKVSGIAWPRKEFRQGLQNLSQVPEDQAHHLITNQPGINRLAGVVNGKLIRIHVI